MNAIVLPTSRKPAAPIDDLPMMFEPPANDDVLTEVGAIFGPEESLIVSFAGLTAAEARQALASFPGAQRCILADA